MLAHVEPVKDNVPGEDYLIYLYDFILFFVRLINIILYILFLFLLFYILRHLALIRQWTLYHRVIVDTFCRIKK